jgi:hypothetical protein
MFKPEISALKDKINFKNKNMTKQDPASTYTTAKFMSELSGIPMNYEEKYPTLNSCAILPTQTTKKKSNFPSGLYKSGDRIRRYSILFREQPLTRIVAKEFIVTRQRALVDFNVEFAVVGKYKDWEGWYSMVPLYKIKDHDFISFKNKTMDNTIIKRAHKKKAEIWSDEEKTKLCFFRI